MNRLARHMIGVGAILAALAVALGAFGAHALESFLQQQGERAQNAWDTATRYHMYAALALLAVGLVADRRPGCRGCVAAAWLLTAGAVLFSGCLYLWVLTEIRALNFLVPVGGTALIAGLAVLGVTCLRMGEPDG